DVRRVKRRLSLFPRCGPSQTARPGLEAMKAAVRLDDPSRSARKARRGAIESLLRRFSGPLTADLVQRPADFGLGHLPAGLTPDATTTMVCGFCSTGCGLNVHLREGQAINLSAAREYPVNLGMACPK